MRAAFPNSRSSAFVTVTPRIATAPPDEGDFRSNVPTVMGMSSRAYFLVRVQDGGSDTEIVPMIPGLAHAIASALRAGGGDGRRRQCRRGRDQHNDLTHVLTPVLKRFNAKPPHDGGHCFYSCLVCACYHDRRITRGSDAALGLPAVHTNEGLFSAPVEGLASRVSKSRGCIFTP